MAGGNETPRQKMIAMMYLVLTALLAMNVSAAILEKFLFLDDSLQAAKESKLKKNQNDVGNIAKTVEERGNKEEEVQIRDLAHKVRERTREVVSYIKDEREHLVEKSGGRNEDGTPTGKKRRTITESIMIGTNENGRGYEFEQKLDDYYKFLQETVDKANQAMPSANLEFDLEELTLDGKQHPMFKNDPEQKQKDFVQLNFEQTPVAAALAIMSEKQNKVATYESRVLEKLGRAVGAEDYNFDKIFSVVKPESNTVPAGTEFKASLFIAATSSSMQPKMVVNGDTLSQDKIDSLGRGTISWTANASSGEYNDQGIAEKQFSGSIIVKGPSGDTAIPVNHKYKVSKPVMQVQSASVSALYRNCGNKLNVQVPALGASYNPSFRATGAKVITHQEKGKVTVIPNKPEVKLSVSSNGNYIDSQTFNVRLVPKPEIKAFIGGKEFPEKKGLPAEGLPRNINIKAVPDDHFKQFLPKDARFRVTKWDLYLVRGKRPVTKQTITKPSANIRSIASKARPGDRIMVEVKDVKRKNFQGSILNVSGLGTKIINLPLTD